MAFVVLPRQSILLVQTKCASPVISCTSTDNDDDVWCKFQCQRHFDDSKEPVLKAASQVEIGLLLMRVSAMELQLLNVPQCICERNYIYQSNEGRHHTLRTFTNGTTNYGSYAVCIFPEQLTSNRNIAGKTQQI